MNFPVHLKNFNLSQLRQLCKELRSDIVHTVSKTGGACASANNQSFPALFSFCKDCTTSMCIIKWSDISIAHRVQAIWAHLWG